MRAGICKCVQVWSLMFRPDRFLIKFTSVKTTVCDAVWAYTGIIVSMVWIISFTEIIMDVRTTSIDEAILLSGGFWLLQQFFWPEGCGEKTIFGCQRSSGCQDHYVRQKNFGCRKRFNYLSFLIAGKTLVVWIVWLPEKFPLFWIALMIKNDDRNNYSWRNHFDYINYYGLWNKFSYPGNFCLSKRFCILAADTDRKERSELWVPPLDPARFNIWWCF